MTFEIKDRGKGLYYNEKDRDVIHLINDNHFPHFYDAGYGRHYIPEHQVYRFLKLASRLYKVTINS